MSFSFSLFFILSLPPSLETKMANLLPSRSLLCALRALVAAPSNARSVGSPFKASPKAPNTGEAARESSLFTSLDAEMYRVCTLQ